MLSAESTENIALSFCNSCLAPQLECDRFCRKCGISRSGSIDIATSMTAGLNENSTGEIAGYETRPLSGSRGEQPPYTNPLIRAVTNELDQLPGSIRNNAWAMRLISTIIAVPIWIMIVLLSPVNAYIAVRAIARHA